MTAHASAAALDGARWFARWEAMQACYVAQRARRFDLLLSWPDLPRDGELRILDLGCGPGSLALHAFKAYPRARILAVDADAALLALGRTVAAALTDRISFIQADLRDGAWWATLGQPFDLVCSATALHWLTPDHLAETYRRIYAALTPGGWFVNSDGIASDDPLAQERFRVLRQARQQAALRASKADTWDAFWEAYQHALCQAGLNSPNGEALCWEGSDDGQPRAFHLATLTACSFERVGVIWQDLTEAILTARKPHGR